ncbi:MAG: phospholipase D family protein [Alphaproteobacteria bacterium]
MLKITRFYIIAALLFLPLQEAIARSRVGNGHENNAVNQQWQQAQPVFNPAPALPQVDVAFAPDAGAETLVLRAINAAQKSIYLAAYSFTSANVVQSLLDAKKRGVDIKLVVDEKANLGNSSSNKKNALEKRDAEKKDVEKKDRADNAGNNKSRAALNALVNAGIVVKTNDHYAIHHDKYIVIDEQHVQTGSFNYSKAAASRNSENVLVIWHNPALAAAYLQHWLSRFADAAPYQPNY